MKVAVFGASGTPRDHADYRLGVSLGAALARAGHHVYTGGYAGLMEAVSRGAADAGGQVTGITASLVFPGREAANPYVGELVDAPSLSERIHRIMTDTEAAVALPGSLGTLTELLVAWNVAFVARFSGARPKPVITLGHHWAELVRELGRSLATDGSLVTHAEGVREVLEILKTHSHNE